MEQEIEAAERAVWEALKAGDAAADAALLSADFLGVYPSGFAGHAEHSSQLSDGPTVAEYTLSDPHFRQLGPDCGLYSYRAAYRRPGGSEEVMFVSSIWQRRAQGWINIFSQDTPLDEADQTP